MKTAKKVLALLLSVLMVFTMVSSSVVAVAETTPTEKAQIEDVENKVTNAFDTVKGIIDGVHNLVGGILSMLGKECVFCDEVHDNAEADDEDTQEPTEPETPPSEPEVPVEPEQPTEPEIPVEPEEPKEDESLEDQIDNAFDSIGNLFDSIHNLVGSILGIFGKECPFCDKVHSENDVEEDKEDETDKPDEDGCYTVTFDLNYNGAPVAIKQKVKGGECAIVPNDPENNGLQFMGWYIDKHDTDFNNYYTFTDPVTNNIILYAKWLDMNDTDGEGLADGLEELYGTDKNLIDTDRDGISDYDEIVLGLDPLLADNNNDGIADGDEDLDSDGLSYLEEKELGTDPAISDTDEDGLSDGDEIKTYRTNPLLYDTDNDDVNDGREVELGTDPNVAQEYFELSIECGIDEEDSVEPLLEIEAEGSLVDNISIVPLEEDFFFPEEMPGYMGKAYDFDVDGDFNKATIKFKFDPDRVDIENGSEPVIYYFDEETQTLEALETTIDGDIAIAEVTHFSTYVLIDRKIYEESFSWIDVWDPDKNYSSVEIILVIDDSGSLGGDYGYNSSTGTFTGGMDPEHKRLEVARTFVDKANVNAKIGIIKFDGSVVNMTNGLVECDSAGKELLKNKLVFSYRNGDGFDSRGSTYMYGGIEKAISQFSTNAESTLKVAIVFTDGIAHDSSKHNNVVNSAIENDVKIYTVGLGNSTSYFNDYLKPLSTSTNGAFYTASNANELSFIYDNISQKIDITTDSDDDGIPDYYEDNMVYFNGVRMETDKFNEDTDGDGLLDGEEIEIIKESHPDNDGKVLVKGRIVMGLPTKPDTDDDGYNDKDDFKPLTNYKTPIILVHGWNSNSTCFGVTTAIANGDNTHYDNDKNGVTDDASISGKNYRLPANHKITDKAFNNNKLGKHLENSGYERNKNLYAFNYPNQDMVQYNARKFNDYVVNLVKLAKENVDSSVTDPSYLFATKEDYENGNVKFILIGHSMGGLISRYYVENLGTDYVEKIITIDTPHFGSGLGNAADKFDIAKLAGYYNPAVYDLDTNSTLYGGKPKKWDWSLAAHRDTEYAINNQSPALKGNKDTDVKYYAIAGYDVGGVTEIGQLAKGLKKHLKDGGAFSVTFNRVVSDKKALDSSINNKLNELSKKSYGEGSKLDLGNSDGDNTVDYMSQFAVRFGKNYDYQELEKTTMIIATGYSKTNPYHNAIHNEKLMHKAVVTFVND